MIACHLTRHSRHFYPREIYYFSRINNAAIARRSRSMQTDGRTRRNCRMSSPLSAARWRHRLSAWWRHRLSARWRHRLSTRWRHRLSARFFHERDESILHNMRLTLRRLFWDLNVIIVKISKYSWQSKNVWNITKHYNSDALPTLEYFYRARNWRTKTRISTRCEMICIDC